VSWIYSPFVQEANPDELAFWATTAHLIKPEVAAIGKVHRLISHGGSVLTLVSDIVGSAGQLISLI